MGQIKLSEPYEIARDGNSVILVARADLSKLQSLETMAQIWQPSEGYGPLTRLQVMFKFLYGVTETIPPIPWVEPTP